MASMKKKIGISLRVVKAPNYDEKRDALSHDWVKFFEKLDCWPIFIPNNLLKIEDFVNELDIQGLVISGGDNFGDFPERDKTEKLLINYGIQKKIPIFGVCRGMQIINRYFGGLEENSLDQKHVKTKHSVIIKNKKIASSLQSSQIIVNSYHNNIIKLENLGENLEPFAIHKDDNTIEGFVHKQHKIIGVMWHPEREINQDNKTILTETFKNEFFWEK